MVLDAVSNFVRGTADAAVGASDTTVSVADASIFPDPATDGEFNVVIWDVNNFPRPDQDVDVEVMRVTARDTTADELTVTRGQETTIAATHPEGSAIHLSPTAKMFSDIESTFGDFWDAGTQELTADVNNTNTTTTDLQTQRSQTPLKNPVVDDFEADSFDYFEGSAVSSLIVDSQIVLQGSQSCKLDDDDVRAESGADGSRGWEYRMWVYPQDVSGGKRPEIGTCMNGPDNGYMHRFRAGSNSLEIFTRIDGNFNTIASISIDDCPLEEWYQFRIEMHLGGRIKQSVYDIDRNEKGLLVTTDVTFDTGGWGILTGGFRSFLINYASRRPL